MDQIAISVLTVPIVPLIETLDFDPIWFSVIKIVTAEVGMITPPVGLNSFARYANRRWPKSSTARFRFSSPI